MTPRRRAISRVSRLSRGAADPPQPLLGAPRAPSPAPAKTRAGARRETPGQDPDPLLAGIRVQHGPGDTRTNDDLAHHPSHQWQTCPDCELTEARGAFCSGCGRKTGPDLWHELRTGRAESLMKARAARQRRLVQGFPAENGGSDVSRAGWGSDGTFGL